MGFEVRMRSKGLLYKHEHTPEGRERLAGRGWQNRAPNRFRLFTAKKVQASSRQLLHYFTPNQFTTLQTLPLAPSPRILALLARRQSLLVRTMALVPVPEPEPYDITLDILSEPKPMFPPPAVVTTPCDPWPRPYFLENGLRRVAPYHFTYNTYCKQRWRGRELLDIFASEFRDRPLEYYIGESVWELGGRMEWDAC